GVLECLEQRPGELEVVPRDQDGRGRGPVALRGSRAGASDRTAAVACLRLRSSNEQGDGLVRGRAKGVLHAQVARGDLGGDETCRGALEGARCGERASLGTVTSELSTDPLPITEPS